MSPSARSTYAGPCSVGAVYSAVCSTPRSGDGSPPGGGGGTSSLRQAASSRTDNMCTPGARPLPHPAVEVLHRLLVAAMELPRFVNVGDYLHDSHLVFGQVLLFVEPEAVSQL